MCRRVVLHELIAFADTSLTPLLGERLAKLLGTILRARIAKAEGGLDDVRSCFGHGADVLEQRMMLLYALREGRARVVAMYEDRSISKEIYDSIRRELDVAWKRAVPRAHPGVLLPGEAGHRATQQAAQMQPPENAVPEAHTTPAETAVDPADDAHRSA
jgi:CPA1 family monovalent cation:H+ antiporter